MGGRDHAINRDAFQMLDLLDYQCSDPRWQRYVLAGTAKGGRSTPQKTKSVSSGSERRTSLGGSSSVLVGRLTPTESSVPVRRVISTGSSSVGLIPPARGSAPLIRGATSRGTSPV